MIASPTKRRAALGLAAVLTVVTGKAQQTPDPKADDPLAMIATAERELAAGRGEDAVLRLWSAAAALQATPAGAARDAAEAAAERLLAAADPLAAERKTRLLTAARPLLAMARAYRGRKWTATANEIAMLALPFDPAAARKELPAGWSPSKTGAATESDDPLARFGRDYADGNWTVVDGALRTPALQKESVTLITKTAHEDCSIGATIDVAGRQVMFGIIVGAQGNDYYIVDHEFFADCGDVRVAVYRYFGGQLQALGEKRTDSSVLRKAPARLEVTIEGARVVASVDGAAIVDVKCPAPVRGNFGFYVSASSVYRGSQAIRAITLSPLPPPGSPDDAASTASRAQRRAVLDVVAAAERELKLKRVEPAVMLLRRARDMARDVAAAQRGPVVESIDRQLAANDPLQSRYQKACGEAGAALRALADAYAESGRPLAAAVLAEAMFRLDPEAQRTRTEELRRAAAAVRERQAELERAAKVGELIDDKGLREWFATGTEPFASTPAWRFGYDGAMSPPVAAGETYRIAARGSDGPDAANVQFQLPHGARAGLAFAWQGTTEFARAVACDGDGGLDVEVQRWTDKGWLPLGRAHWVVSAAEREGWIQLGIRHDAEHIVVRCLGRELSLANPGGRIGGRFGLYAGNLGTVPVAVHFRAFVAGSEGAVGPAAARAPGADQPGGNAGK